MSETHPHDPDTSPRYVSFHELARRPADLALVVHGARRRDIRRARIAAAAVSTSTISLPQAPLVPPPSLTPEAVSPIATTDRPDQTDHAATPSIGLLSNTDEPITVRHIQDLICADLAVSRARMLSAHRVREVTTARHIAMYLSKKYLPHSFPLIGRLFGGRDHTTVIHACTHIKQIMEGAPGTGISLYWDAKDCDFVRNTVNAAEATIAKWKGDGNGEK